VFRLDDTRVALSVCFFCSSSLSKTSEMAVLKQNFVLSFFRLLPAVPVDGKNVSTVCLLHDQLVE
jgi:hypothetical protein